jgi:hypothetical protein
MKFHVNRQHLGDRMYMPGETREAAEADVKHLLASGVLSKEPAAKKERRTADRKAEPALANKAEPAPANKSA